MKLTLNILQAVNEVFYRLNNTYRSWEGKRPYSNRYNELDKQALNCIIAYMLAACSENAGKNIMWGRFPKIAIYRAFQKAHVMGDTAEYKIHKINSENDFEVALIEKETIEEIARVDKALASHVSEGLATYEFQIYKAATKIASYIELVDSRMEMNGEYVTKVQEVLQALEPFEDISGVAEFSDVESDIFKVLCQIAKLRNQIRWTGQGGMVSCSVLGHLFDTGVFAYFMGLEETPNDEDLATKMFFLGVFHDVAEAWTTDISSVFKNRIPGFREATEKEERKMLEEKMYRVFPPHVVEKLKEVELEAEENESYKRLMKGADYLSADSECWRQYEVIKRKYFLNAMHNNTENIETGRVKVTSICKELHETLTKDAENFFKFF